MKIKFLSYQLDEKTPAYGGGTSFERCKTKSIAEGGSCNQMSFTMNNHLGTHVDAPLHFVDGGRSISDYEADFWSVTDCRVVHYAANLNELIDLSKLNLQASAQLEFLILKTDFCFKRDQEDYWKSGPGITANSADFLRENFPKLRFLGFDFISLTSYQNRDEGRKAHRNFLGSLSPILIVEDMDLRDVSSQPIEIVISPLRIREADGTPVTIFAKFE